MKLKIIHEKLLNFELSAEELRELAAERWGDQVLKIKPSFEAKGINSIVFFGDRSKSKTHSKDFSKFLKNDTEDYFFANYSGLIYAEELDKELNFLEVGSFLLAPDRQHHLPFVHKLGHFVFCTHKCSKDKYEHILIPRAFRVDQDELLLAFGVRKGE